MAQPPITLADLPKITEQLKNARNLGWLAETVGGLARTLVGEALDKGVYPFDHLAEHPVFNAAVARLNTVLAAHHLLKRHLTAIYEVDVPSVEHVAEEMRKEREARRAARTGPYVPPVEQPSVPFVEHQCDCGQHCEGECKGRHVPSVEQKSVPSVEHDHMSDDGARVPSMEQSGAVVTPSAETTHVPSVEHQCKCGGKCTTCKCVPSVEHQAPQLGAFGAVTLASVAAAAGLQNVPSVEQKESHCTCCHGAHCPEHDGPLNG